MRYQDYVFQVPEEKIVRLITDTDAKNEADDDFAVVQALLSPKIENVGLVGAHYGIGRDADSMQKSYEELGAGGGSHGIYRTGAGAPRRCPSHAKYLHTGGQ